MTNTTKTPLFSPSINKKIYICTGVSPDWPQKSKFPPSFKIFCMSASIIFSAVSLVSSICSWVTPVAHIPNYNNNCRNYITVAIITLIILLSLQKQGDNVLPRSVCLTQFDCEIAEKVTTGFWWNFQRGECPRHHQLDFAIAPDHNLDWKIYGIILYLLLQFIQTEKNKTKFWWRCKLYNAF